MQWELVVALVVAIPVILFPAAYVWYLNIDGAYAAVKKARASASTKSSDKPRRRRR